MTGANLMREVIATARANRAYSLLFACVAFVLALAQLVLVAQAEHQRAELREAFQRAELRTFELRPDHALDILPWELARWAGNLSSVETAWVAGESFEVLNEALPSQGRVAARMITSDWEALPVDLVEGRWPQGDGEALIDVRSNDTLGVDPTGGSVASSNGEQWAVVGVYRRHHPRSPEAVLVPARVETPARLAVVTVAELSQVEDTMREVVRLTYASSPGQVRTTRSEEAPRLGVDIMTRVTRSGGTILVTMMVTSLSLLVLLSLLMVNSRRQEFGRRRALGATRPILVALVLGHGLIVVASATGLALMAGSLITWLLYASLPDPVLLVAILATVCAGSSLAQLPSAFAAGFRDPVQVLRTP